MTKWWTCNIFTNILIIAIKGYVEANRLICHTLHSWWIWHRPLPLNQDFRSKITGFTGPGGHRPRCSMNRCISRPGRQETIAQRQRHPAVEFPDPFWIKRNPGSTKLWCDFPLPSGTAGITAEVTASFTCRLKQTGREISPAGDDSSQTSRTGWGRVINNYLS